MSDDKRTEIILPRREVLRAMGGGALLLILGEPLSGCRPAVSSMMSGRGAGRNKGGLQAGAIWPMRGHDVAHTGRGVGSGARGVLKWKYTTGKDVDSSPAIGSDGTVYVGSDDHNLYAIK